MGLVSCDRWKWVWASKWSSAFRFVFLGINAISLYNRRAASLTKFLYPILHHGFISKLVPQPQLLVAAGFPTILNWLPISSIVKSTLLPFSSSRLGSSMTTFAPEPSPASNTVSSSGDIVDVLVRDIRYWNP